MKKFTLVFIAFQICSHTIYAQWSSDPQVADTKVCIANTSQHTTKTIPDGSGGVIVFWHDPRNGPGDDIYYNRLNSAGNAVWSSVSTGLALTNNGNYNYIDQVISDGSGGAFISWETDNEVLVQHINSTGEKIWTANGISLTTTGQSGFICSDGNGGIIIAWSDYRDDPDDERPKAYAQRISNAGAKSWTTNGVLLENASGFSLPFGIIPDGNGGAIIPIFDTRNSNYDDATDVYDNLDIYAQRINSSGNAVWAAAGVPVCTQAGNQNYEASNQQPYIVSDGVSGAIICWEDYRNDANNGNSSPYNADIFCQRINASGTAQWTVNGVALCTASGDQYDINLMPDGSGGVVAAWYDERNDSRVYAQKLNSSGLPQWVANGKAIINESNDFSYTASPDAANSSMLVAWASDGNIKAQKLNVVDGILAWGTEGTLVCGRTDEQSEPFIAHNGSSGAIVSWTDDRNGVSGSDIYANRVLANGTLPVTFVSFVATAQKDKVVLQWSTATEVNSKDFIIERSLDGAHFENIGSVAASGNSNTRKDFTFNDGQLNDLRGRTVFYRIKEADLDGKVIYSDVRKVTISSGNNQFTLLYNPVRNEALFNYSGTKRKQVTIRVIDHLGRVIISRQQTVEAGNNQIRIQTHTLPGGMYEVELHGNDEQHIVRMVKE